jgi:hypothetical protein
MNSKAPYVTMENQTPSARSAYRYFVLSYCLFLPAVGALFFLVVSPKVFDIINPVWAFAGLTGVYASSVVLGLLSIRRFADVSSRKDCRALIVGIVLSGLCALLAIGLCTLCHLAHTLSMC